MPFNLCGEWCGELSYVCKIAISEAIIENHGKADQACGAGGDAYLSPLDSEPSSVDCAKVPCKDARPVVTVNISGFVAETKGHR